ncbi:MAG: GT-D fold domain-containing glycosyltransferase [Lachnospiraceae bacterium]|nr:GT-D fold domain-containing glycosyltransferase [Lachnospiraceae bacterium]
MEKTEYSSQEINQMKWQVYNQLLQLKQRVLVLYRDVAENDIPWTEGVREELETIASVLCSSGVLFAVPSALQEKCRQAQKVLEKDLQEAGKWKEVLESLFEAMELLEEYIGQRAKKCNACNSDVFFTPILSGYESTRKQCGFLYWNADFQLESKENYGCPVCGAYDRDRLMIAFLEEVRAEGSEKLRMLQIAPSPAIERYALGREDILYESTDLMMEGVTFQADLQHMDMVADETYDIIVCAHVLEHVENDARAMQELHRILKPDGVCLVLVPLIVGKQDTEEQWGCSIEENWRRFGQGDHSRLYGKEDFIRRLQTAGFYVNELGKEWFGEAFYQEYGFDDLSIMYVATKEIALVEQEAETTERELEKLREENKLLRQAINNMNEQLAKLRKASETNFTILFHTQDNLGYEVSDRKFQEKLWYPRIMSAEDTFREIIENKKSIARFGDGEFGIIFGEQRWRFQGKNERLALRLKEALQSKQENLLIGLNDFYGDLSTWTKRAADGVRIYLTPEIRKKHYELLERDRAYACANISRNETPEGVKRQKQIWEGRDCVFIEGFQTRMGVGNDLFDNARSIVRILCPAENAFDRYEDIYNEALKQPKDRLMLIALGPTASVLAYDLALQGYQAIDIGHADLSYEWMLRGNHNRVPEKYSNEAPEGYLVEEIYDETYESQIIADFHA